MQDSYPSLYRVFLVGAVWIAIAGACFANQYLILEYAPAATATGFSAVLWAIEAIAALVVTYFLSTGAPGGGWPWTLRTILPAGVLSWMLAAGIFGTRAVSETFFIPAILGVTAALVLWRTNASLLAWTCGIVLGACAAAALLKPAHARRIMASAALVCFLLAAFCYWQSPARVAVRESSVRRGSAT